MENQIERRCEGKANGGQDSAPPLFSRHSVRLLAVAVIVAAVCSLYVARYLSDLGRAEIGRELQAIAELKLRQLERWRSLQESNADALFRSPFARKSALRFLSGRKVESRDLLARMEVETSTRGYARLMLMDEKGQVVLDSSSQAPTTGKGRDPAFVAATHSWYPVVTDLHLDSNCSDASESRVLLEIYVPVPEASETAPGVRGMWCLEVDPRPVLFELLKTWPVPSESGEALLVERDGDHVVFISDLRLGSCSAFSLRLPREPGRSPSVKAVHGQRGFVEGVDYRGRPVVAWVQPVTGTPWFLVVKMDTSEALGPVRREIGVAVLALVAFVVAGILALWSFWGRRERVYLRGQLELEMKGRALSARLAEESERLLVTLRSIGDAVVATDRGGTVTLFSDAAERLAGWRRQEALGTHVDEVLGLLDEGTRQPLPSPVAKVLGSGEPAWLPECTILKSREGAERSLAGSCTPLRIGGGDLLGAVFAFRDVTEQRTAERELQRSEERFRRAVIDAPFPIVIHTAGGETLVTNTAWCRQTGYASDGSPPWAEWMTPAGVEDPHAPGAGPAPGLLLSGEWHVQTRTGERRTWLLSSSVLDTTVGGHRTCITMASDVTELREAESRLRQAEKLEAVGLLAGGVAHDFNNQLAAIMGNADLLVASLRDPRLAKFAGGIVTAARRSSDLTRQLLAFARQGVYNPSPVDVHVVVLEVVHLLERAIDKRIGVVTSLEASPHTVMGDAGQLQSALMNLALNGRDAMPQGGTLTIGTRVVELDRAGEAEGLASGQYLEILVTDTGHGMDENVRDKIFEPFFTTKKLGRGTGLGLAAVHGTVARQGGGIRVASSPGLGTAISLLLPLCPDLPEPPAPPGKATRETGPASILVVDDEELVRECLAAMLESGGHRVTTCAEGQEAVDVYRRSWREIDLVILDVVMPVLGGPGALRIMRGINPLVRALFLSGYSRDDLGDENLGDEAVMLLQKPISASDLLEKVGALLVRAASPA